MSDVPPYARLVALGMAVAAAVGLLVNHFMIEALGTASLLILCLAPIALALGIGGTIEPRIVWALGKYGEHLPTQYKVIGGLLGMAGLLFGLALIFLVYRTHFGLG